MLRYIINLLLMVFFAANLFAQDAGEVERIRGLRIGYDLSRPLLPLFNTDRFGQEMSADMELNQNNYVTVDFGIQTMEAERDLYNYSSNGYYGRVGFEHNFLKNLSIDQYETVFGGFRLGYANTNQSAKAIVIPSNYWQSDLIVGAPETSVETYWLEVVGGVKAEVLRNIFIGWTFHARLRLYQSFDPVMQPLNVPGFGAGEKRVNIGFSYYVYYRIPLMRYTPKEAETDNPVKKK